MREGIESVGYLGSHLCTFGVQRLLVPFHMPIVRVLLLQKPHILVKLLG
jgi:hypothetical protein